VKSKWKELRIVVIGLLITLSVTGCASKPQEQASEDHAGTTADQTIVDEWKTIVPPPAPELKPVTVDTKTTALLILDMQTALAKNPRTIASIPKINQLLSEARGKGTFVVYSLTSTGKSADIVSDLVPVPADPIVKSGVDKFYNTNLDTILHEHGIKTVIITGTAANGAVLHTATGATLRGYQVIIPVEGMSAADPYAEQYTAWHMLNGPGTRNRVTLTKVSLIDFET
jgi:nicotinamidase-related amidase